MPCWESEKTQAVFYSNFLMWIWGMISFHSSKKLPVRQELDIPIQNQLQMGFLKKGTNFYLPVSKLSTGSSEMGAPPIFHSFCLLRSIINIIANKTENPFSLQDDEKIDSSCETLQDSARLCKTLKDSQRLTKTLKDSQTWLAQDLHMTCTWLAQDLLRTCTWPVSQKVWYLTDALW